MSRLVVVRHGQTAWNAARRIQGSTDIPLDPTGREQAARTAALLAGLGGWTHVVSSPMRRAAETAAIIAGQLELPVAAPLPGLVERDCGDAEGLTVDEADARWPGLDYPGSETLGAVGRRTARALTDVADGTVVVGHGQALRRGLEALLGEPVPRIANAEAIVLERDAGRWRRVDAAVPAS